MGTTNSKTKDYFPSSTKASVVARIEKDTATMVRLYVEKRKTLREIAERFNISRQAVHARLTQAGVVCRSRNGARNVSKKRLEELHLVQGLPVSTIAQLIGSTAATVAAEFKRHGINRSRVHPANRKYPELDTLQVGDSITIPCPAGVVSKPYGLLYSAARFRGIRVSVKTVSKDKLRITRIA